MAYYELAFSLAEMEEELDRALDYAEGRWNCRRRSSSVSLGGPGLGALQAQGVRSAVEFLARASELGPSAATLTHLGMALLASGEEERARTC